MVYQIKNIASGEIDAVASLPLWIEGVWECGDQRFTDPAKTLYEMPTTLQLTAMALYLAFTPAERIAIKKSTDPIVEDFWATYELAADQKATIDPTLASFVAGLTYLATPTTATPPGPGILASPARIAQIQAGIAQ